MNSPSDNQFAARDSGLGQLSFTTTLLNPSFHALNSVVNGINPLPNQFTSGEGPVRSCNACEVPEPRRKTVGGGCGGKTLGKENSEQTTATQTQSWSHALPQRKPETACREAGVSWRK